MTINYIVLYDNKYFKITKILIKINLKAFKYKKFINANEIE